MTENNIQTIMEKIIQSFQPERAAGVDATIQFHLTGDQGGDWYAVIRDKKLAVEQGTIPDPRLSLSANTQDILNVFNGKLNPMMAYMQGKVQVKGDMNLAMRLADMFKPPSH